MVKVLALRLNQCFGPFAMSSVEASSQTGAFKHLSKHLLQCRQFQKYRSYEGVFLWKSSKFNSDLKNEAKNWEQEFCFWDKFIWIACIELSPLRRECLSSAVNVLKKSLQTFHVTKTKCCNSITFTVITQDDKGALIKIESVFWPVYLAACREVLSNGSFSTSI